MTENNCESVLCIPLAQEFLKKGTVMADCEIIERCIFFHDMMETIPATADVMKRDYCQGSNADCARYMVLKVRGSAKVPADLYPGEFDRAIKLIS
jgi:hypothetical protein